MDKTTVSIGLVMLLLASGFIFISYDGVDDGIKLMSEDDYENYDDGIKYDLITKREIAEMERRTSDVISEKSQTEQLEELRIFEIELYGKEISDFNSIGVSE